MTPTESPARLITEIAESEAQGEIAQIYDEIRRLGVVPMVATIYRHLATMPGALEWSWAVLRPVMLDGALQRSSWEAAKSAEIDNPPQIPPATLEVLGLDREAMSGIYNVLEAYNRSNPINIVSVLCLARKLAPSGSALDRVPASGKNASAAGGAEASQAWVSPPPLSPLPAIVDPARMSPPIRALAALLSDRGRPDVAAILPGLYRHLAAWPAILGLAGVIVPSVFTSIDMAAARMRVASDLAVEVLGPTLPDNEMIRVPMPDEKTRAKMLAAFASFSIRIPEMVAIGALLRRALPNLSISA